MRRNLSPGVIKEQFDLIINKRRTRMRKKRDIHSLFSFYGICRYLDGCGGLVQILGGSLMFMQGKGGWLNLCKLKRRMPNLTKMVTGIDLTALSEIAQI